MSSDRILQGLESLTVIAGRDKAGRDEDGEYRFPDRRNFGPPRTHRIG